jgi:hypothetical protein
MDEFELHVREWTARERIRRHARSISERLALDPDRAEILEEAAESGGAEELHTAVADFLAE